MARTTSPDPHRHAHSHEFFPHWHAKLRACHASVSLALELRSNNENTWHVRSRTRGFDNEGFNNVTQCNAPHRKSAGTPPALRRPTCGECGQIQHASNCLRHALALLAFCDVFVERKTFE